MNFSSIFDNAKKIIVKNTPEILVGLGLSALISSTVFAVKATPKACRLIEKEKKTQETQELTVKDTIKTVWKEYIPSAVLGLTGITLILSANGKQNKQKAVLASVATMTEKTFKEYRNKIIEKLGEEKEKDIRADIDWDKIKNNPPPEDSGGIRLVDGYYPQTLCYETSTGRYFYSDVDTLKKAENKLNRQMVSCTEPYISLNDFYDEVGLSRIDIGDDLGWNTNNGLIEICFSSHLANGRTPCLAVSFVDPPRHDFNFSY